MRSVDRMMEEKRRINQRPQPPGDDSPDEVDITVEKPLHKPLDTAKSAFDEGVEKRFGGINTAPSVFDARAVFKTGE